MTRFFLGRGLKSYSPVMHEVYTHTPYVSSSIRNSRITHTSATQDFGLEKKSDRKFLICEWNCRTEIAGSH